jgi:hypothetical protein
LSSSSSGRSPRSAGAAGLPLTGGAAGGFVAEELGTTVVSPGRCEPILIGRRTFGSDEEAFEEA